LADVSIARDRRVVDEGSQTVLARLSGGAIALAERAAGKGRLIVFASDLDNAWSRFPLSPSFVPFAIETVRYFASDRRARHSFVLPDVPAGVPPTPGVATLADKPVVVNLDVTESNPSATTADEFRNGIERLSTRSVDRATVEVRALEDRQRLWQAGLLLMLVALAGEGFVGRRAT
jgi:hypothetical protein